MKSNELLDAVKDRAGVTSDYALARDVLKVDPNSVKEMRERGLSDARALQIATLLQLEPGPILAAIHAERAKDPAVRKAWEKLAKTLRSAAAAILIVLGMAGTAPDALQASQATYPAIHYAHRRLRAQRAARAGILAFWRGLSTLFRGDASMLMKALAAAALLADFNAAHARNFQDWTDRDTAWQAAYLILHAGDWSQTRYIARRPDEFHELNPILGEHPSIKRVDSYMAFSAVAHTAISYALPPKYRRPWQQVTIGLKAGIVGYNYSVGIRFDF